jgi:glycosyltransferase involved in cell wall biosynthesis
MYGGRGFVLQDAIPDLRRHILGTTSKSGGVVFICRFNPDEPVKEVIEAARLLGSETTIYVTGRVRPEVRAWNLPANIKLTGFLPEKDYLALLQGADAVLVLTTRDHTLTCGAYEGLAFQKPLVLSDKPALRSYFGEDLVYVDNTAESIAAGIRRVYSAKHVYDVASATAAERLDVNWRTRFREFMACVEGQPSGL